MSKHLSREQVCQIPNLLKEGYTTREIADYFEVTTMAIRNIILQERWKKYSDEDGHPDRCPDCGSMVVDDLKPCLFCSIANLREQEKRLKVKPNQYKRIL